MKILLADDNQDILHLVRKRLEVEGYNVLATINGADVLDIVKSSDIDIMALNINLPHLRWNKIDKAMSEKDGAPVIFILPENLEKEIIPSGTNINYINKPFHPDELFNRIRMAVQIKRLYLALKDKEVQIEEAPILGSSSISRKYVMKRLLEETSKAKRYKYSLSCLICELNQGINSTQGKKRIKEGHQLKGNIIKQVEKIIINCTRKGDIIARFNSDKFIILLPHTLSDGAIACSEKIIKRVQDSRLSSIGNISVIIGSSTFPVNADDDQEQLINRAVMALKKAKKMGAAWLQQHSADYA